MIGKRNSLGGAGWAVVLGLWIGGSALAQTGALTIRSDTTLTTDVVCTTSPCVTLTGSNYTFDGNRHTIDCNGVIVCVVLDGTTGVTVTELTIENGGLDGLTIIGGASNVITHVTSRGNSNAGFSAADRSTGDLFEGVTGSGNGGFGIVFTHATKSVVQNSSFAGNGIGISFESGTGFDADHDTVTNNDYGVLIATTASGCTVATNRISGSANAGITVDGEGNTIRGNTSIRNGTYGIVVNGATNQISGNVTRGNSTFAVEDTNLTCDRNTWTNNRFRTSGSSCIH